jgi:hypothetical protein
MSIFELREWMERSIPAWVIAIPVAATLLVVVYQWLRKPVR